ncbi:MAG TPA: DUF5667 domain-containing protein [Mycobacteriales bacterium]|nr:DUF5667 domain-containing protein [Mycobacteriales bacterium]
MRRPLTPAQQFAAALDGLAVDPARGSADPTSADSTTVVSTSASAVSPLLALAQQLQALPLGPTPDFRDTLRTRLLAVAAVSTPLAAAPTPAERVRAAVSGWRVQRGLAAATAGMAAVVGIAGVSTAGVRSLPGDPFYSVKRGTEGVQLALTRGEVGRGKRHLAQAESRLDEVAELVGDPNAAAALFAASSVAASSVGASSSVTVYAFGASTTELLRDTLSDMDSATRTGTRLLTAAYAEDRDDSGAIKALASFVRRQKSGLADVIPALPSGARAAGATSLALIADVEMQANALLTNGSCGENCAPAPAVEPSVAPVAPIATPAPAPQPTPDESTDAPGSEPEPSENEPEPTPTPEPQPQPTREPEPQPSPTPSRTPAPEPTPSPSPSDEPRLSDLVPTAVPEPVRSPVVDIIDTIEDLLPSPLAGVAVPAAPNPAPPGALSPRSGPVASAEPRPAAGPAALPGAG